MRRRLGSAALALVTAPLLVTSCSGSVDVAPPELDDSSASAVVDACAALTDELPDRVVDQPPRSTTPDSPLTAAWGDPAILLRCGVPRPPALTATSQLVSVNGVDWFAEELTAGYVFTTVGRSPYVEVTVPDDYAPEIAPVTELSAAVAAATAEQEDPGGASP